jgi:hypothetical protein
MPKPKPLSIGKKHSPRLRATICGSTSRVIIVVERTLICAARRRKKIKKSANKHIWTRLGKRSAQEHGRNATTRAKHTLAADSRAGADTTAAQLRRAAHLNEVLNGLVRDLVQVLSVVVRTA